MRPPNLVYPYLANVLLHILFIFYLYLIYIILNVPIILYLSQLDLGALTNGTARRSVNRC
jgi:hypothetical protein